MGVEGRPAATIWEEANRLLPPVGLLPGGAMLGVTRSQGPWNWGASGLGARFRKGTRVGENLL